MYDNKEPTSPRRSRGNLAAVVSVRFDPREVELLRQAAPGGKVSRFVREAAMREVRRLAGGPAGGIGRTEAGAPAIGDPAVTSAPSTGAFSIAGTAGERPPGTSPWDVGPEGAEEPPPTTDG
jgi:hypothetical protein